MKDKLKELIPDPEIKEKGFAIGNDLVFLPDFESAFTPLFQKKIYTPQEIDYCEQFDQSILRYASTWSAKEAVYKAIKQIRPASISFKKIEITRTKISGIPGVNLPENYADLKISLSISHDGDYVWSVAIIQTRKND